MGIASKLRTAADMIRRGVDRSLVTDELRATGLDRAVAHLRDVVPEDAGADADPERPVFVLSAGWRCGSTLLQRLVSSDPSTLIWGEPFGDWAPVPRMASMLTAFEPDSRHLEYSIEHFSGSLTDQFIANLNPGVAQLKLAHRRFIDDLLARNARERGFAGWGAKWVRLNGRHAVYLKWLYPGARFVFIVRDPMDAYRSYKGRGPWFSVRPIQLLSNVWRFAAHWDQAAASFLAHRDELDAMLVRYEDLISRPEIVDELEAHLELRLDRDVLGTKVGQTETKPERLPAWERWACRRLTRETAAALGYAAS